MDIISHGLWGGLAFGRSSKRDYWLAFLFGILPDLLSFGVLTTAAILGLSPSPDWQSGPPSADSIPQYVHILYNYTHSLVIFALVFGMIWALRRRAYLPLIAWGLHIFMDIFEHSISFFPTPFLWPLSNFRLNGIPWSNPWIFFPNWIILVSAYGIWLWHAKHKKSAASRKIPRAADNI